MRLILKFWHGCLIEIKNLKNNKYWWLLHLMLKFWHRYQLKKLKHDNFSTFLVYNFWFFHHFCIQCWNVVLKNFLNNLINEKNWWLLHLISKLWHGCLIEIKNLKNNKYWWLLHLMMKFLNRYQLKKLKNNNFFEVFNVQFLIFVSFLHLMLKCYFF